MISSLSDDEFLEAFESCTIPKEEWTHLAHVRMAWLYLGRFDYETALSRVRSGIQRYNASVGGSPQNYHETVTQVYLRLIHCLREQDGDSIRSWEEFRRAHPELFDRTAPLTLRHYRMETISSPEARDRFVEPDLLPLPV